MPNIDLMKKILTLALFLVSFWMQAQNFQPRETWPFLYEQFMDGAARTRSGSLVTEARFNIGLQNSALLYIGKDGVIMKADMGSIYTARLGEDPNWIAGPF